ncbi:MAG: hypothetical protein H6766_07355 [Candidatus Peribacteria bacterium]|nr:MAG: hypothetical protein H6766_07355 [Candidatus Peribacteria bacterium]
MPAQEFAQSILPRLIEKLANIMTGEAILDMSNKHTKDGKINHEELQAEITDQVRKNMTILFER